MEPIPTDVAAIGEGGHYPVVTLTGFCTMLLSRMAEAATKNSGEFQELSLGLVRLLSGWIAERGVEHVLIHDAVDVGVLDYRDATSTNGDAIDIPIEESH